LGYSSSEAKTLRALFRFSLRLPTLVDSVLEQRCVSYARFSPQSYLILSSVLSFLSYSH